MVGARCERCGAALQERDAGVCAACASVGTRLRPAIEVSPDELIADALDGSLPPVADHPSSSVVTTPSGLLETGTGKVRVGPRDDHRRPRAVALTVAVIVAALAAVLVLLLRGS